MKLLDGKNILLGVTGSIAIYKALELTRLYIKAGANVKVLMSEDAKRFITPLSFEALSGNTVISSDTESWCSENNHIKINKWADIFVIAPATANTINKLSNGIADNLLTSTALAFTKDIVIAPAANTIMYMHKTTQSSILKLKEFDYTVVNSQNKLLACGDLGNGALADIEIVFFESIRVLNKNSFWNGKNVIVTGGGTIEKIDDVRYISNFSSGKMADALTLALYTTGANVSFIKTYKNEDKLPIKYVYVNSANDMKNAIQNEQENNQYLFMVAAVSDFKSNNIVNGKIKKEQLTKYFNIEFSKNIDILTSIDKSNLKVVGFKAELDRDSALKNAKEMLINKNINAVCLNIIDNNNPFGSDKNRITYITDTAQKEFSKKSKLEISFEILENVKEL